MNTATKHRLLLLITVFWLPTVVWATDLHRLWEDRCGDCHGDAGHFAREVLTIHEGVLQGRQSDRDLRLFLQNHYLKNNEIDAVYTMLLAQTNSQQEFQIQCSNCHGKAAEFVRAAILRRDGRLYGRRSGVPLDEFLAPHRRLTTGEAAFFLELLDRIEQEIHHP